MPLWIGTSGWQYRHWRERFYPRGLDTARWLDVYVQHFDTVELNVTFYRQPKPAVFEAWARRVPADFRFAVKASRYLTHMKRLKDCGQGLQNYFGRVTALGDKLGPIVFQLPERFRLDAARLEDCAKPAVRHPRLEHPQRLEPVAEFARAARHALEHPREVTRPPQSGSVIVRV